MYEYEFENLNLKQCLDDLNKNNEEIKKLELYTKELLKRYKACSPFQVGDLVKYNSQLFFIGEIFVSNFDYRITYCLVCPSKTGTMPEEINTFHYYVKAKDLEKLN